MKFKIVPSPNSYGYVYIYQKKFGIWFFQTVCRAGEEAEKYIAHRLTPPKYYDSQKT